MTSKIILRKIFRASVITLGTTFILATIIILWAVGTSLPKYSDLPVEDAADVAPSTPSNTLRIATYNIAHGQGIKVEPTDWRDEPYTKEKLGEVAKAIRAMDADIVLLQEVDFRSNRTHLINQVQWILDQTPYSFWACATLWDENYIPFPYWPIEHQLGRMEAGNCILSRYPLENHRRVLFEKPKSNPFWYNWAYIERGAQIVTALIGDKKVDIINLHLEAWDHSTRERQTAELFEWIGNTNHPLVIGGDFNAIPPEAPKKSGFADDPKEDLSNDRTVELIRKELGKYTEALSQGGTFPANSPNRQLDHIFVKGPAKIVSGSVFREAKLASDHLPVVANMELTH